MRSYPEVPPSLLSPTGAVWGATGLGMLALPPTRERGPWPGALSRSMDCDWVEGPLSCAPGRDGSRCTPRVEVPLHLSLFIRPSGVSKVYRNEMGSTRDKKDNQPIRFR